MLEIGCVFFNNYLFVLGDIVVVNFGIDDGVFSSDKWWFFQVNKLYELNRDRFGCYVFGFWLNEQVVSKEFFFGRYFLLLFNFVKIYFGSIIKDNKILVVVLVEELSLDW